MNLYELLQGKKLPIVVFDGEDYIRIRMILTNHIIGDLGYFRKGSLCFYSGGWIIGDKDAKQEKWLLA